MCIAGLQQPETWIMEGPIELDHLLIERIPGFISHRRRVEVAAGWVRVQVAADESHVFTQRSSSAVGVLRIDARRLRELADADEILGDRAKRHARSDRCRSATIPALTLSSPMWCAHAQGAGREDGQVGAALPLQPELASARCSRGFFVVGHLQLRPRRHLALVFGFGGLGLLRAKAMQVLGLGGVVAVAVDDHGGVALVRGWARWGCQRAALQAVFPDRPKALTGRRHQAMQPMRSISASHRRTGCPR